MIRTAILAGLLLVMFSMAYSRSMLPGVTSDAPHVQTAPAPVADPAPVPAPRAEQAQVSESPKAVNHRNIATVRENLLPTEPLMPKLAKAPPVVAPPAPPAVVAEAPVVPAVAPAPEAPKPAPPVKAAVADVAWPAPLPGATALPPQVQAEEKPVPVAAPKSEDKPLPLVTAATPVNDMPVREVATPPVHIPHDLPLPSEAAVPSRDSRVATVASEAADLDEQPAPSRSSENPVPHNAVAKANSAPQFMSPQDRSRELYRLAREMEDTFIAKLAH